MNQKPKTLREAVHELDKAVQVAIFETKKELLRYRKSIKNFFKRRP